MLPQYHAEPTTAESATDDVQLICDEFIDYSSEKVNMSMKIPPSWNYAIKEGTDTYVNPADGASIAIGIFNYYPSVNNETESAYINQLSGYDGTLNHYAKIDASSFTAAYQISDILYYEVKSWDLSHCMIVTIAIPAEREDYYYDSIIYLFDTIQWIKENPLPESVYIYFNEFGSFQFGVPLSWNSEIIDGVFVCQNPDTNGYFTVNVEVSEMDLSTITQFQYLESYGQKQGYILSSYSNTNGSLSVEASYTENDERISVMHNVVVANGFLYEIKFESLSQNFESDRQLYLQAISLFKTFF